MDAPIKIIQFTDSHLFAAAGQKICGLDTYQTLITSLDLFRQEKETPDLIFFTGDNSQDTSVDSYRRLMRLESHFFSPVYALPGNHDDPVVMRNIFKGTKIKTEKYFSFGSWQFLFLDSNVLGSAAGHLSNEELRYLEEKLKIDQDRPMLVGLHHQILPVGSKWLDTMAVRNRDLFWEIVRKYPHVRGVVFGHVHQEFEAVKDGVHVIGTPSTCFQFKPNQSAFMLDDKPPGYRWLELHHDCRITTGVKRVAQLPPGLDLSSRGY